MLVQKLTSQPHDCTSLNQLEWNLLYKEAFYNKMLYYPGEFLEGPHGDGRLVNLTVGVVILNFLGMNFCIKFQKYEQDFPQTRQTFTRCCNIHSFICFAHKIHPINLGHTVCTNGTLLYSLKVEGAFSSFEIFISDARLKELIKVCHLFQVS